MDKYSRELELILMLSENTSYSVQQMAGRLGVTPRNVYNYLDHLHQCGFVLVKSGSRYRLDRSSGFFRRLHENISLSADEAAYMCRRLSTAAHSDYMAHRIRQKLSAQFDIPDMADPEIQRRASQCLARLREAVAARRMVMIHGYSSPHSHTVSDRIVEPFLFVNDACDVRCHEIKTHTNKTFKLSRMDSVEILDVPWAFEREHRQVFTDLFMFAGERRHTVTLRLGQLSRNLMLEEYPQSCQCITPDTPGHWLFKADVASFLGVGRFVLGLHDDIEVLGCDEFREYIAGKIRAAAGRVGL